MGARDCFLFFYFSNRLHPSDLEKAFWSHGMRRPKRKVFCVVAEIEKVVRHIQKTKHKETAFKTIKSLMFFMVNQVLIN